MPSVTGFIVIADIHAKAWKDMEDEDESCCCQLP